MAEVVELNERANKIYNALQDDISRELFNLRMEVFMPGYCSRERSFEIAAPSKGLILYGAGWAGEINLNILKANGFFDVICFCDSAPGKWGTLVKGLPVISPEKLIQEHIDKAVLVSTTNFYDEIYHNLLKMGFPENQIIDRGLPTQKWPKSKAAQYFGEPIFKPIKNEIFVDVGAYTGDTIEEFMKFSNGEYKKIYALEPDKRNYKNLQDTTSKYDNIIAINKGAWSSNTTLSFTEIACSFGSKIGSGGDSSINVIKIDDMLEGDAATLIKMDVEGAELQALMGAAETIKRHKPRLAICIYHKLEDVLTIPEYIQSLVPEYKFFIRHHSTIDLETVLYATLQ